MFLKKFIEFKFDVFDFAKTTGTATHRRQPGRFGSPVKTFVNK